MYVYIFSRSSTTIGHVAPFLYVERGKGGFYVPTSYMHVPLIVREIENNNNGVGEKNVTKNAVLFNPKQSRP